MARILVIDDDGEMRETLRQFLGDSRYEVVYAPNGKEGIRLYHKEPADLVITDLIRLEKQGIDAIIELRSEFPDVKIITISRGDRMGSREHFMIVS